MLQTLSPKVHPVKAPIVTNEALTTYQNGSGSEAGLFVSEERYWAEYYEHPDFNYEWNNGYLEEKGVSNQATVMIYRWFSFILDCFLKVNNIAQVTSLEMGFKTDAPREKKDEPKGKQIRKPDLAVVLHSNPVPFHGKENSYRGVFDMCVEALSYTTRDAKERDTIIKKGEYEQTGTKEYFILDDSKRETAFYRLNQWGLYEEIKPIDGDIIQSEVLPGFQFRISDLYRMPLPEELVKDEVYQGYILLSYQKAEKEKERQRQRAEQAEQRAAQAEQRAEQERTEKERQRQRAKQAEQRAEQERAEKELQRQRAKQAEQRAEQERAEKERLLAMLKELGIELD